MQTSLTQVPSKYKQVNYHNLSEMKYDACDYNGLFWSNNKKTMYLYTKFQYICNKN